MHALSGVTIVIEPHNRDDRSLPRHLREGNLQHACLESYRFILLHGEGVEGALHMQRTLMCQSRPP